MTTLTRGLAALAAAGVLVLTGCTSTTQNLPPEPRATVESHADFMVFDLAGIIESSAVIATVRVTSASSVLWSSKGDVTDQFNFDGLTSDEIVALVDENDLTAGTLVRAKVSEVFQGRLKPGDEIEIFQRGVGSFGIVDYVSPEDQPPLAVDAEFLVFLTDTEPRFLLNQGGGAFDVSDGVFVARTNAAPVARLTQDELVAAIAKFGG